MLFNSFPFLFIFLPGTLLGFFLLSKLRARRWNRIWLVFVSLIFYAIGDRSHWVLLLFSISINFCVGHEIQRFLSSERQGWRRTAWFAIGMAFNLGLLGFLKYAAFAASTLNTVFHASLTIYSPALPLGISFYTFMQVMYLVDCYSGLVTQAYSLLDYMLFVSFFPYTLAGPIVKHEEIIPQFNAGLKRPTAPQISQAFTLFGIGLFKKVVLADNVSRYATPVFAQPAQAHVSLAAAWLGVLAFTLQLYFDFSGYSDMAVALGQMVGIRLPFNFNSPYKAINLIDFWKRWHMTLTRFLTNYIYNPIVIRVARWRLNQGLPVLRSGQETVRGFVVLSALPTLITMFVSGLWHGAGWHFILFGLLHGIYLTGNHAVRILRNRGVPIPECGEWLDRLFTFIAVMISFVFFRADSTPQAWNLICAMIGKGGWMGGPVTALLPAMFWVTALLVIVWFFPNSQEWCFTDKKFEE